MYETSQVVEAVALVVSALPGEQRAAGLGALLSPIVASLHACLQRQAPAANSHALNGSAATAAAAAPAAGDVDHVLPLVERMTIVFRCAFDTGPAELCHSAPQHRM